MASELDTVDLHLVKLKKKHLMVIIKKSTIYI